LKLILEFEVNLFLHRCASLNNLSKASVLSLFIAWRAKRAKLIKCFSLSSEKPKNLQYFKGDDIQTFFSSDACELVELYLKERKRKGENINENSWLFVSHKDFSKK